jgi:hypothetical protein
MKYEFCTQPNPTYGYKLGIKYVFLTITTMETVSNLGRTKEI